MHPVRKSLRSFSTPFQVRLPPSRSLSLILPALFPPLRIPTICPSLLRNPRWFSIRTPLLFSPALQKESSQQIVSATAHPAFRSSRRIPIHSRFILPAS